MLDDGTSFLAKKTLLRIIFRRVSLAKKVLQLTKNAIRQKVKAVDFFASEQFLAINQLSRFLIIINYLGSAIKVRHLASLGPI